MLNPGYGLGVGRDAGFRDHPYVLEEIHIRVETLADGSHITTTQRIRRLRNSGGQTRRETYTEREGQPVLESVQLYDPDTRTSTFLVPAQERATVVHLAARKAPNPPPQGKALSAGVATAVQQLGREAGFPAADERRPSFGSSSPARLPNTQLRSTTTTEALPEHTIAGVRATGVRSIRTFPVGLEGNDRELRSTSEVWTSPELQTELDRTTDDYRRGKDVYTVVSLEQKEPRPALFQIPPGYKVVERWPLLGP